MQSLRTTFRHCWLVPICGRACRDCHRMGHIDKSEQLAQECMRFFSVDLFARLRCFSSRIVVAAPRRKASQAMNAPGGPSRQARRTSSASCLGIRGVATSAAAVLRTMQQSCAPACRKTRPSRNQSGCARAASWRDITQDRIAQISDL